MDQAIACCGTTLSGDVVRGLVGTVSSDVIEDVMDAVARNSSEDVLRIVDRLLVEGQSAQHFTRQMLRFLRNALVAKTGSATVANGIGYFRYRPMSGRGSRASPRSLAKKI